MKKFISLILSLVMICCVISIPASAVESPSKNFYDIRIENLVERSGTEFTFSKTQILPESRNTIGVSNYRTDLKKLIFNSDENADKFENALRSSGTNTEETMDDSLLVTLTTTIYYSISPSNVDDRELIRLTKVTGSYTSPYAAGDYMGNGVYCVGSEVRLGQIGFRLSGGSITNQVKNYDMGTKRSWSITPPSNWESIVVGDQEDVGCRYQVILSRGSSEWIAELSNNH